jgi:hypothetical protein
VTGGRTRPQPVSSEDNEQVIAALRAEVTAAALQHSGLLTAEELGCLLEYERDRAGLDRDN